MKNSMKSVELEISYCYKADVIMPRGRKPRPAVIRGASPLTASLPSITAMDAPCAFVLREPKWRSDQQGEFSAVREILSFDDRLWLPAMMPTGPGEEIPMTVADLEKSLGDGGAPWRNTYSIPIDAVRRIVVSGEQEEVTKILDTLEQYVLIDGVLFTTCTEPCFEVATFGLGHNHGGTALFSEMHYNSNINRARYFRADQRDEAIAEAERIALARGDTESVPIVPIGDIEVLLPECVRRHPEIDGPDGNPFLNQLYGVTEKMPDATSAGFAVLAVLAGEIAKDSSGQNR